MESVNSESGDVAVIRPGQFEYFVQQMVGVGGGGGGGVLQYSTGHRVHRVMALSAFLYFAQ